MTESEKSDRLNQYKTYSGILDSLFSLPFQGFATMLLPLFLLLVSSKNLLLVENQSLVSIYAPGLFLIAIPWLLNQGRNALNVQFDPPVVQFVVSADDAAPTSNFSGFPFTMTSATNSAQVAGISSLDTILRNVIRPSIPSAETSCSDSMSIDDFSMASIQFGFPHFSWLESLLPESISSEDQYFSFSTSDNFTTGSIDCGAFPSGSLVEKPYYFPTRFGL